MSEMDTHDQRWAGYPPWFLRHSEFEGQGDFHKFFDLVAARVKQIISKDELNFNIAFYSTALRHFLVDLKNRSFKKFNFDEDRFDGDLVVTDDLRNFLYRFFLPISIDARVYEKAHQLGFPNAHAELNKSVSEMNENIRGLYFDEIRETIFILEVFLQKIYERSPAFFSTLRRDLRQICVFCGLMLDIQDSPVRIILIDEPLFQKEVLGKLLPRLQLNFPQEAQNLVEAYHQLVTESDTNKIFGNAFKALEVIGRTISGNPSLMLSDNIQVKKAFPGLHPTTIKSVLNLAAHRGDEGGHGGKAPPINQMRYLLLHVCNVALLLLETRDAT